MGEPSHLLQPDVLELVPKALAETGLIAIPQAVHESWWRAFAAECRESFEQGAFRHARVGRGPGSSVRPEIRGDWVSWIDPCSPTELQREYLDAMEDLRCAINGALFCGIFAYEGHLARYPAGTGYKRHLDRFRDAYHRLVTCILYLNEDWQESDGGALRIWIDPDDPTKVEDILPCGGTLVVFLSDRFWHEVRPALRNRLSVTGWFTSR